MLCLLAPLVLFLQIQLSSCCWQITICDNTNFYLLLVYYTHQTCIKLVCYFLNCLRNLFSGKSQGCYLFWFYHFMLLDALGFADFIDSFSQFFHLQILFHLFHLRGCVLIVCVTTYFVFYSIWNYILLCASFFIFSPSLHCQSLLLTVYHLFLYFLFSTLCIRLK